MYGYIYITTNIINEKKYIGQKASKVFLKNKYLGSGKILHNAINKYGRENFKVELLEECNSREELDKREIYWISYYDAVNSDDFYNLQAGGHSGNIKGSKMSEDMKNKMKEYYKNHPDKSLAKYASHPGKFNGMYGKGYKISGEKNGMYNKSNRLFKEKNGCYRKIRITNEEYDRFIFPEELQKFILNGWRKGSSYKPKAMIGKENPNYGRRSKYMNKDGKNKMVLLNEINEYLSNGWKFGMIRRRKENKLKWN